MEGYDRSVCGVEVREPYARAHSASEPPSASSALVKTGAGRGVSAVVAAAAAAAAAAVISTVAPWAALPAPAPAPVEARSVDVSLGDGLARAAGAWETDGWVELCVGRDACDPFDQDRLNRLRSGDRKSHCSGELAGSGAVDDTQGTREVAARSVAMGVGARKWRRMDSRSKSKRWFEEKTTRRCKNVARLWMCRAAGSGGLAAAAASRTVGDA